MQLALLTTSAKNTRHRDSELTLLPAERWHQCKDDHL